MYATDYYILFLTVGFEGKKELCMYTLSELFVGLELGGRRVDFIGSMIWVMILGKNMSDWMGVMMMTVHTVHIVRVYL